MFQVLLMVGQWFYQNVQYTVKNQESKGLLSKLGIRTSPNKVQILGDTMF